MIIVNFEAMVYAKDNFVGDVLKNVFMRSITFISRKKSSSIFKKLVVFEISLKQYL